MKKIIFTLLVFASTLVAWAQHGQYVGGDMSMLPQYEAHNSAYLDREGKEISNLINYVRDEAGWNTIRVRLFVNPQKKNQKGKQDLAVCQDLDFVKSFGRRIKEAGMNFMLDFHYSDTWADPSYQKLPAAWSDCKTAEQKAQRVYDYTKECLEELVEAGAKPDLVQVGNEISYGIVDVKVHPYDQSGDDWAGFLKVLEQGCQAVREVCPQAKIVIHTERAENSNQTKYYYEKLAKLDYDVIGLSYYPFWHGDLNTLGKTLSLLHECFPEKEVQIVETAYNFQYWPTSGVKYDTRDIWPCSPQGQCGFVRDLIAMLKDYEQVSGLLYWFPEEAGNGDDSDWDHGGATVLDGWLSRGLWHDEISQTGHWPVISGNDGVLWLMREFLSPEASINLPLSESLDGREYNIAGQRVSPTYRGLIIKNGRKIIRR